MADTRNSLTAAAILAAAEFGNTPIDSIVDLLAEMARNPEQHTPKWAMAAEEAARFVLDYVGEDKAGVGNEEVADELGNLEAALDDLEAKFPSA